MKFEEFCNAAKDYCNATTGSVTSWGRTPKHNHSVGGVAGSYHPLWRAVDVVYDTMPSEDTRLTLATRVGLKLLIESDHDHLQPL